MPVPAVSNNFSLQCVMGMIGYTKAPGLSLIKERTFCCISEHVNKLGYFIDYRYIINGLFLSQIALGGRVLLGL
jgi:hypothetical protein